MRVVRESLILLHMNVEEVHGLLLLRHQLHEVIVRVMRVEAGCCEANVGVHVCPGDQRRRLLLKLGLAMSTLVRS